MPIIQVQLIEGRTPEKKHELMRELANVVVRTLDAPEQSVRVILTEVPAEHWGIGTKTKAEKDRSGG